MKILLIVLQMSFGILSYTQEPCEAKGQKHYHIISTIVKIPITYCFFNVKDDFKCEDHNAKNESNNIESTTSCVKLRKLNTLQEDKVVVCESTAQVDLLKNIIVLPRNISSKYSEGEYVFEQNDGFIIWIFNECEKLSYAEAYSDFFDLYLAKARARTYIRKDQWSLELKSNVTICNLDMRTTNCDGIGVASSFNMSRRQSQNLITCQSTFDDECKMNTKNVTINLTKTWYVYRFVTDVTVFRCSDSCKPEEHVPNASKALLKRCKTICRNCKLCKQILQIDLRRNTVQGLSSDCKYSDGECRRSKAFWNVTDICETTEKLEGNYQENCSGTKCVIRNSMSTELILLNKGNLCGGNVRFTDRDGIFAAEKELLFMSKTAPVTVSEKIVSKVGKTDALKVVVMEQDDDLNELKAYLYYLLFFVVVCILGYLFSVIVNFFSLRNIGKARASKNSVHLMNCFSQSLTNRYVFLGSSDSEESELVIMSQLKESELYESVDDK